MTTTDMETDPVLEHALLRVVSGSEADFESAFFRAHTIIAAMPGFRSLRLERCLEESATYLLLVEWDRLESHTVGFRRSAAYAQWKDLLHHFYQPFPEVRHFRTVLRD